MKYLTWASELQDAMFLLQTANRFWPEKKFEVMERPCFKSVVPNGKRTKERVQTGMVLEIWETS